MSAIDHLFRELKSQGQKAFMPFVTAGDPDLETTAEIIRALDGQGCHLCEVGVPYSDPIADGPVIQASYTRALDKKIQLSAILKSMSQLTTDIRMPLVSMVSYAIVFRHGLEAYVDDARRSGLAGLIVPDLPIEESAALAKICDDRDISLIQLVTPTTPQDRAIQIANSSSGFIYYVSVTGITGERRELPTDLVSQVAWLREQTELPICIGFGISRPEHVQLLAPVADGIIVGSAFVRHLERLADEPKSQVIPDMLKLAEELQSAL
jgi:tryptophan synthase alpha chain